MEKQRERSSMPWFIANMVATAGAGLDVKEPELKPGTSRGHKFYAET